MIFRLGQLLPLARLLLLLAIVTSQSGLSQDSPASDELPAGYILERVRLEGTSRLNSTDLARELGLYPGTVLDEALVASARSRLLSLGLFKSVLLAMAKGSTKGRADLIVRVEEDGSVLSDWALGGSLGIVQSQRQAVASGDPGMAPLSYELGLIGRNLFRSLHRGSLLIDMDGRGALQKGHIAYGLPRFALEDTQFDAQVAFVNPRYRYLESLGFGLKASGLWSLLTEDYGSLRYGMAMYVNDEGKFAIPGYPASVAGPVLAYTRSDRLLSFIPGEGYALGASLLWSVQRMEHAAAELNLAQTLHFGHGKAWTISGDLMSVGLNGYAVRTESRLDVPILHGLVSAGEQAEFFVRLRAGMDARGETKLRGTDAILGLRYHSSGFIAEIALKFTRFPEELGPGVPLNEASRRSGLHD